jgi:hypothetical protein
MPVTPNIIQAAKQTAKARVLTSKTRIATASGIGVTVFIVRLFLEGD